MGNFDARDRAQLAAHGIPLDEAQRQLELLREPPRPFRLDRPCRLGNGVRRLSPEAQEAAIRRYELAQSKGRVGKFVPASGAATRMFRELESLREESPFPSLAELGRRAENGEPGAVAWQRLAERWYDFPWATAWDGPTPDRNEPRTVLEALLAGATSLARAPKGLVPYHRTETGNRSAFAEHVFEGLTYLYSADHPARFHFTVAREHSERFHQAAEALSATLPHPRPEITFSFQEPATDTLAIDAHGHPTRHEDGTLLLRPGGHGALIGNLAATQGDVVLVKTIDNVRPQSAHAEVAVWQRILGGYALDLRDAVDRHLRALESDDDGARGSAVTFIRQRLGLEVAEEFEITDLRRVLDRPLRVCGVVENTGEPGGGPFWVRHEDGRVSRQIVEAAEVAHDAEDLEIWRSGTHFNPVLLACLLRDRNGAPYPLDRFIDPRAVFVSDKSYRGQPLRALERPGLWNGAMSGWTTLFAEVPAATFAPVKTVFDLLRPQHQPGGS